MFEGFSTKTVDFMWGIRLNNNREWFEQHKQEYKDVLARPMNELAGEVFGPFSERHPKLGVLLHVSRIYRDARRLRGRGPYKDHLWFTIRKPSDEEWTDMPAFWFELSPDDLSYGMGYYHARSETMAKHRARIDADPSRLLALDRALAARGEFSLEGEEYKRREGGGELAAWYRKKWFSLIHEEPLSAAIESRALVGRLSEGFEFLLPYFEYFASLEADPAPTSGS